MSRASAFVRSPLRAAGARLQPLARDLFDRAVYVAARLVSVAMHAFPVNTNLQTAKFFGSCLFAIDRRHRERALANLRRSFPEMPERQRARLARRSMQQMVMLFVEVLFTTRLIRLDTWAQYVELENFRDVLDMLLRRERGLILLTGHYGNWEILGYVLATLGFETVSIARPLDNPYVSKFLFDVRERTGQRIIAKKGATPEVQAALDQRGAVGFIADQNAGTKGVFVDFFGRKASTYKSIGLVAMEYEVPVVIGYARRVNDRFHFQCGAQDIIYPQDWKSQPDPLRYITERYTQAIENIVRVDPGQYWWLHRRWKTRPKGEAPEAYD
jgi:KDO2-lipid IV(A) lauroyltransferase